MQQTLTATAWSFQRSARRVAVGRGRGASSVERRPQGRRAEITYLDLDERENGPGQVSLLYGESELEDRLVTLADHDDWNGYPFPSTSAESGHMSGQTIRNWFDALVDVAGIPEEIEGEKPVLQMGRQFWYDRYSSSMDSVAEGIEGVATEQGSSSPEIVFQNYLSDERAQKLRREYMRKELATVFE